MARIDPGSRWQLMYRRRVLARKTLTQLARDTGLSLPYLSQVEKGERGVSVDGLHRIADALGIDVLQLEQSAPRVPSRAGEPRRAGAR